MKLRWQAGMLIADGRTVVGSVSQGAGGDWFAYGALEDWEDTRLGVFDGEQEARETVESWVREKADEE